MNRRFDFENPAAVRSRFDVRWRRLGDDRLSYRRGWWNKDKVKSFARSKVNAHLG